jgi:beta-lysine 5,6-aminomutase beta subunit
VAAAAVIIVEVDVTKESFVNEGARTAQADPHHVKFYGDRMGDGIVQLSFTLPVTQSEEARVAAQNLCEKMNLKRVSVVHMEALEKGYTFFVVYASLEADIDITEIKVPKLEYPDYSFDEINTMLSQKVGRRIVVLGACIGTDAHTVGIDAIFNMKGYLGHYGLERYPSLRAINLRAQVDTKDLVAKVIDMQADAVLVSRVVTQRDSHIFEFKKFLTELQSASNVPPHLIKICGGPRMTHKEAVEIGYDAGFGPGTLPSQVASYIATEITKRISK